MPRKDTSPLCITRRDLRSGIVYIFMGQQKTPSSGQNRPQEIGQVSILIDNTTCFNTLYLVAFYFSLLYTLFYLPECRFFDMLYNYFDKMRIDPIKMQWRIMRIVQTFGLTQSIMNRCCFIELMVKHEYNTARSSIPVCQSLGDDGWRVRSNFYVCLL